MVKKNIKRALIGGLIAGAATGCASLKARDGLHLPISDSKMVEAKADIDLEKLIDVKLERLIDAKLLDKSSQQKVATSQPVTAGRDAKTISPIVTINGSDSILLVLVVCGGLFGWLWYRSRRTVGAMVKAVEELPDCEARSAKALIAKRAYQAGVSQDLYNRVQRELNRSLKNRKLIAKQF